MNHNFAVILAGGRGERFWPMSTSKNPKQLLSLIGDRTMIAQSVDRLKGIVPMTQVFIITNADLADATHAAVPDLPRENVVGEPMGRDTAAAVALACALVKAKDPEGVFAILTADHVIGDLDQFKATLNDGMDLASREDALVTIGIDPTEPSTGYGYIEAGDEVAATDDVRFLKAVRFVEKPDRDTAASYIEQGNYFWNSGMFIWSVKTLRASFAEFRPQLIPMMDRVEACKDAASFEAVLVEEYPKLERISVDYAIMENAKNIVTAVGTFSWDDVGSWPAVENHFDKDPSGNIRVGTIETVDASNNIVYSGDGHLTALIGVSDLVVVQAKGATMICPRDRAQDVKKMVEQLRISGQYDALL